MALNGISTLATKELKQKAKLNLAAAKRVADGSPRSTYDITQLPTQYSDNTVVDNPNTGGLVQGRPWISTPVTLYPLLYLDAGDTNSYSGSGTTWTDLSTYQNNATLTGSPAFTNASAASYFSFNGSNQYAPVTASKMNVAYTGKTTIFSIRTVNANTANATYRALFGNVTGGTRNFNTYMYHVSGNTWQIQFSTGPNYIWAGPLSAPFTVTDNEWIVIAVTQTTGGILTYYVNGQQIGTPETGVTFSQYISGGAEAVALADNYWRGDMGVCAIYGQALTASAILQNFNAYKTNYGL